MRVVSLEKLERFSGSLPGSEWPAIEIKPIPTAHFKLDDPKRSAHPLSFVGVRGGLGI